MSSHTNSLSDPCSDFLFGNENTLTRGTRHLQVFSPSTTRRSKKTAPQRWRLDQKRTPAVCVHGLLHFFIKIATCFVLPVPDLLIRIDYNLFDK